MKIEELLIDEYENTVNTTIIVYMPRKMRAALNQFFTGRYEDEEVKLQQKI